MSKLACLSPRQIHDLLRTKRFDWNLSPSGLNEYPLIYTAYSDSVSQCLHIDFIFFPVCNRTYYGDVGKTYELKLGKPIDGRLPFLCHLTFTANGDMHGEIVQVSRNQLLIQ